MNSHKICSIIQVWLNEMHEERIMSYSPQKASPPNSLEILKILSTLEFCAIKGTPCEILCEN